jgi:hypothetical protein
MMGCEQSFTLSMMSPRLDALLYKTYQDSSTGSSQEPEIEVSTSGLLYRKEDKLTGNPKNMHMLTCT